MYWSASILYCSLYSVCTSQSRQIAKLFLQLSELGLSHPLSRRRVSPPLPPGFGGRTHSLVGEGCRGVPIPTREHTLWYSLDYKYFVVYTKLWWKMIPIRPPFWQLNSDGIFVFNFVTFWYWMSLISSPPRKHLKQALYMNFKFIYHLVLNLDEIFQGYTSLYFAAFSS